MISLPRRWNSLKIKKTKIIIVQTQSVAFIYYCDIILVGDNRYVLYGRSVSLDNIIQHCDMPSNSSKMIMKKTGLRS